MSVLPAGRSLESCLPDLEEFLLDPRAYLTEAPLAFGARRMYRLALLFALPGVALLLSCLGPLGPQAERLAMGVGLLAGASVWLLWSLMLRGHEIVLHPDGVEVSYRGESVWAPWALFNVDGEGFVPEADSPRAGLILPVAPEAVPYVELRRDGVVCACGRQVEGRQWRFSGSDEVVLPGRYEVAAEELGELLLRLGRRLGRELPRGAPPPEAYGEEAAEPEPDAEGWLTVSLTRLRFPPHCCGCCAATRVTVRVQLLARGDWVLGMFTHNARAVDLQVPLCAGCQARVRARQGRGEMLGLAAGLLLGGGVPLAVALARGLAAPALLLIVALLGMAIGGVLGIQAGIALARKLPVRVRDYAPQRGTLAIRFDNPDYAAEVLQAIRTRGGPEEPKA
jgi:hypothetical protein